MILIFPEKSLAECVLAGELSSLDAVPSPRVADPTDIDELRLYFLEPEFQTARSPRRVPRLRSSRDRRMMVMKNADGSRTHVTYDGKREYLEPAPRLVPMSRPEGIPQALWDTLPPQTKVRQIPQPWRRVVEEV